jgi:AraC-like DNA-binding protein
MTKKYNSAIDIDGLRYNSGTELHLQSRQLPFGKIEHVHVKNEHEVNLLRETHTIIVFSPRAYTDGRSWIDGELVSGPRSLDRRIDFIPAQRAFRGTYYGGGLIEYTAISIDPQLAGELSELEKPLTLDSIIGANEPFIRSAAERLINSHNSLQVEALATLLTIELHELSKVTPITSTAKLTLSQQRKLSEYIEENLHKQITLEQLAALCGMSRHHFSRSFKLIFSLPPYQYILSQRSLRACQLLSNHGLSIGDVAQKCGFGSISQFSKIFKAIHRITPSEFRQRQNIAPSY